MKQLRATWRAVRMGGARSPKAFGGSGQHSRGASSHIDWFCLWLALATILVLSAVISVNLVPDRISLHAGDTSPREVRANRSVTYLDAVATEHAQQASMLGARGVYDIDEDAAGNANRIVQEFFDRVEVARTVAAQSGPHNRFDRTTALREQLGSIYSRAAALHLLSLSPALLEKLRVTATRLTADAMDREIRDTGEDMSRAEREVATAARAKMGPEDAQIVATLAHQALRPTRLLNHHKTEAAREARARTVSPIFARIQYGDRVIGKGELVTQEHLDKFTALGLINPHLEPATGAAICALTAMMVVLVVLFINRTLPELYADRRRLVLLSVIVLLSIFGLKAGAYMLGLSFTGGQGGQAGYLGMMSVAAAGMLVSVLIDRGLSVVVVALLALQSGLIMNHEIRFTIMTLLSGLAAITSVGDLRRKCNLPVITATLAAANLVLVWLLGALFHDSFSELLTGSAWAVATAAFATFLFWFGLLALEKPFGILSHQALLELSSTDRPLLARLCAVAPGTYAHSIMVGTLAEAGAQAAGADSLLCRVAGCYHDIGKMKKPEFFIENQRAENVHCRLSPSLSSLIIIAHVRDGVGLAEEHRLPREIRDIVAQHHGTTLIRYFYHQALTDSGGSEEIPPGLEGRFRYPGPKPQSREAAIVMLADSVEAAARTLHRPDDESLSGLIAAIFREKIEDGQLDECEITLKDLKGIAAAFQHVLMAMMHGRIDYPAATPRAASGQMARPDHRMGETVTLSPLAPGAAEIIFAEPLFPVSGSGSLNAGPMGIPGESGERVGFYPDSNASLVDRQHLTPFTDADLLYGHSSSEDLSTPRADEAAAPGGAEPPRRRGPKPRRG